MKEINKIKNQYIKNTLNFYFLLKKADEKVGLVFYVDVTSSKDRLFLHQLNKKTTMLYILLFDLAKILQFLPKYPNFYFIFESFSEITNTMRLNAFFIKINSIFCCSKKIFLQFLDLKLLPLFFCRIFLIFKLNLFNFFKKVFKIINFKIYEFN